MVCYLCGNQIDGAPSRDHVPPQQLFAPAVRREHNVSALVTLPTHPDCNGAYNLDEEYTVRALAIPVYDSPTARAVVDHGWAKARRGSSVGLHRKLMKAATDRPSELILPDGKAGMKLEGARVKRIIWKITRGLYFLEHAQVLPEHTKFAVEVREPETRDSSHLDDLWETVRSQPSRGAYQAVFAHKYFKATETDETIHGWAMLWWDRMILYCAHFDPSDAPRDVDAVSGAQTA